MDNATRTKYFPASYDPRAAEALFDDVMSSREIGDLPLMLALLDELARPEVVRFCSRHMSGLPTTAIICSDLRDPISVRISHYNRLLNAKLVAAAGAEQ